MGKLDRANHFGLWQIWVKALLVQLPDLEGACTGKKSLVNLDSVGDQKSEVYGGRLGDPYYSAYGGREVEVRTQRSDKFYEGSSVLRTSKESGQGSPGLVGLQMVVVLENDKIVLRSAYRAVSWISARVLTEPDRSNKFRSGLNLSYAYEMEPIWIYHMSEGYIVARGLYKSIRCYGFLTNTISQNSYTRGMS